MSNKEIVDALNKEALFTCEMLCAGVTQIRYANYANRGIYFQSFTSLSTGLERIGKICLMLDYSFRHNGNYPNYDYMKNKIGHDIEKIYIQLYKTKEMYSFELNYIQDLEMDIYKDILNILSKFAKGDRYSNIDFIANKRHYNDPIEMWYKKVDLYFFKTFVSQKKKDIIKHNAKAIDSLMSEFTAVIHTGEDEKDIRSVENAVFRTGIFEAVAPYRQFYVFQIIRFFVEILFNLQDKMIESGFEIPYFVDIFGVFYNDDRYIKTRKTWKMI